MRALFSSAAGALLLALAVGCASPRYVGSVGRDDVYANRGYGVLARLGGLDARWRVLDPSDLDGVPPEVKPKRVRAPLDLDGDGMLQVTETTIFYRPTLRLVSKTSSVARIDLDVEILGENNAKVPLDALIGIDLKSLTKSSTAARQRAFGSIERGEIGGVDARRAEVEARLDGGRRAVLLAVADVPGFTTEEGLTRRQVVRVTLVAEALDEPLRADFDRFLSGLLLAPKGSAPGVKEQW